MTSGEVVDIWIWNSGVHRDSYCPTNETGVSMRRKLLVILAAMIALGPTVSVLCVAFLSWGRLAADYVDTTWVVVWIVCSYVALVIASDRALQALRSSHRRWYSVALCGGTAAGCVAGLLGIWVMWLTPWRPYFLIVNGLALPGLFYLLYRGRCRFELRLFGLAFAVGGLALYAVALREVYAVADMTTWTRTEGTITHSRQSASKTNEFRTKEFAYEYVVGGQRYVGTEDSWKSSRMRRGWEDNLDQVYPAYYGEVAVYYDPAQPERAVLRPGLSYATAFLLKASFASMLGGMALLMASARIRTAVPAWRIDGCVTTATEKVGRIHRWAERTALGAFGVCAFLVTMCIQPIYADAMRVPRIDRIPVTAAGFCERGLNFLWEDQPQRAFNSFTHALQLDPNDAALYYNRGHACAQLGQIPQALADWQRAIELDWSMTFRVYYGHQRLAPDNVELDRIITEAALNHLGDLKVVSGYAVGAMGGPGAFYTASLILSAHLREEDFLRMAANEDPVTRAMALICLARRDVARHRSTILSFCNDAAEIMYMPAGCGASPISLGTLAKSILDDPNTLQYWDPGETRWLRQQKRSK
jgi:tetratricopeptide (TPR) repeat protein